MKKLCLALFFAVALFAETGKLQIISESRTPEPENAEVVIAIPENGDVEEDPVYLQLRVQGFALGVLSNFPRNDEVYNYPMGQTLRIIIDDRDFFAKTGPKIDPLEDQGDYYQAMYQVKLPFKLSPGRHVIRAFLARSFGESLKTGEAFVSGYFYFKEKSGGFNLDLEKPYLTYNEPDNSHGYTYKQPILLDFLVSNCYLSEGGYEVELKIDGSSIAYLSYPPYYIYNLARGEHEIELVLVDKHKKPLKDSCCKVKRVIRVF